MTLITKAKSILVYAGFATLLSSCTLSQMAKMAEEQKLTVTPSPLELHGDSVKFDLTAELPSKMIKKSKIYTIKTWYEYGDPSGQQKTLKLPDSELPKIKVETPKIKESFSFAYVPGMEVGELKVQGVASNIAKTKYKETAELPVATGLIMTSRLFSSEPNSISVDHGYNNKEELEPHHVEFFFEQGKSKLRTSETVGQQGQMLTAFIASKNKTRTVTIYGSHSPEGQESTNSKLAEERATVIRDFYTKKMKDYDYKNLADSIKFETKTIFQDWAGLKKELTSYSGMTSSDKAQVTSIINSSRSFEDKAKALSDLPFYKTLLNDVYPKLRISKTEILSVKEKKTNAEISILATAIYKGEIPAESLSYEELMYAATLTPLLEEQMKIYEAATKSNDSWKSHNNLGATYVSLAKKSSNANMIKSYIEKAQQQFELAANKNKNATVLSNLANTYMMTGNYNKATETYNKASKANGVSTEITKSINDNIGAIAIKKGEYRNAISLLNSGSDSQNTSQNLGLAYLLKKDYPKAAVALNKATSDESATSLAYYLQAILAARQNNETALAANLTQAVKKDAKLKAKALNDAEFSKFVNNPAFTNALK